MVRDVSGPGRALQTMDSGTGKKMKRNVLVLATMRGVGWGGRSVMRARGRHDRVAASGETRRMVNGSSEAT